MEIPHDDAFIEPLGHHTRQHEFVEELSSLRGGDNDAGDCQTGVQPVVDGRRTDPPICQSRIVVVALVILTARSPG